MIKIIFSIPLFLVSLIGFGQKDSSRIPIPMKNGIVHYEKDYSFNHKITSEELYVRALNWFNQAFRNSEKEISIADKKAGRLVGTGAFKIITSESGNYYWIKPVIDITVSDRRYIFQAYDYYEKPVEKGISNEYSKIEYRWWDFRQGKPWSSEDRRIFEGLDQTTLALMASLQREMSK
jgi:hypothetical protein